MEALEPVGGSPLAALSAVRSMLESAVSVEDVRLAGDKAEALRLLARKAGLGLDAQNRCAEIRLRAERRAGQLLADMPDVGPGKGPTLGPLGLTKNQSSRWQRIASLPDDTFESYLTDTVDAGRELTSRGAVQLARTVRAQDPTLRPRLHVVHPGEPTDGGLAGLHGQFSTIVADPPWQYNNSATRNAAGKHYPTMTVEELCDLSVEAHAADTAHLYLWTTAPFLRAAFEVLEAWGFEYRTNLVWVKPQMGMGNYFRVSHEHVLFGIRGGLRTSRNDVMSWFQAPRGAHSAKPESFLDIVESSSPGPYLEMFARRRRMGAWTYWGNEA